MHAISKTTHSEEVFNESESTEDDGHCMPWI